MNFMVSVRVLLVCEDVEVEPRATTGRAGREKRVDGRNGVQDLGPEPAGTKEGPASECRENYCPNERMKRSAYVDSQKVVQVVQNHR